MIVEIEITFELFKQYLKKSPEISFSNYPRECLVAKVCESFFTGCKYVNVNANHISVFYGKVEDRTNRADIYRHNGGILVKTFDKLIYNIHWFGLGKDCKSKYLGAIDKLSEMAIFERFNLKFPYNLILIEQNKKRGVENAKSRKIYFNLYI